MWSIRIPLNAMDKISTMVGWTDDKFQDAMDDSEEQKNSPTLMNKDAEEVFPKKFEEENATTEDFSKQENDFTQENAPIEDFSEKEDNFTQIVEEEPKKGRFL